METEKTIGDWEFGGAAYSAEDNIIVVPALMFHKGSIWTKLDLPAVFNVSFTLSIPYASGAGQAGFSIYYITKYGEDGTIHGGPSKFQGISLSFSVIEMDDGTLRLHFEELQDQFRGVSLGQTSIACLLNKNDKFMIKMKVNHKHVDVLYKRHDKYSTIHSFDSKVPLYQNYLGITAANDRHAHTLTLHRITFSNPAKGLRNMPGQGVSKAKVVPPPDPAPYRNPYLQETAQQLTKKNKSADVYKVLDVVKEISRVSQGMASYKTLNEIVKQEFVGLFHKWTRRSLRAVERVKNSTNVTASAIEYGSRMVNIFNSTLSEQVMKTSVKIIDLQEILGKGAGFQGLQEIAEKYRESNVALWIMRAIMIEAIAFCVVLVVANLPFVRRKWQLD